MSAFVAALVLKPLLPACAAGLALSMWLCWRWRLEIYPVFNGTIAVATFLCLFALAMAGGLTAADYYALNGGEEPTLLAFWLPFAVAAVVAQLAFAALRAGLAR
jgi:hypothetical protein